MAAKASPVPSLTEPLPYCEVRESAVPVIANGLPPDVARAIIIGRDKWLNGTVLRYYFFDRPGDTSILKFSDGTSKQVTWVGDEVNRNVVRQAFKQWKDLGIGLSFQEVNTREAADVRIGFQLGAGSWSYVGKGVLDKAKTERTMNFGWDLTANAYGQTTALHEIGHTLGMPHEHQNPFSGIVWDEPKVYAYFSGPPNNWNRDTTFHNLLRKLDPAEVQGSAWDPKSIMHYKLPAGLILQPAAFKQGVTPPGTLSDADKQFVTHWFPKIEDPATALEPFVSSAASLKPAEQVNFRLVPKETRRFNIGTFGDADTMIGLYEDNGGDPVFIKGDDDSGEDRNALIRVPLVAGRPYILRVRLYSAQASGTFAVMYW